MIDRHRMVVIRDWHQHVYTFDESSLSPTICVDGGGANCISGIESAPYGTQSLRSNRTTEGDDGRQLELPGVLQHGGKIS
jgi:hypothetical protein